MAAIAAGGDHNLALKSDGTVVAWGWNAFGQAAVPADLANVIAVAAGSAHSLALKSDGTVVAWGWNYFGQAAVPAGLAHVVAIAAGGDHSLALKSDGTVVAWGDNSYGQSTVPADAGGRGTPSPPARTTAWRCKQRRRRAPAGALTVMGSPPYRPACPVRPPSPPVAPTTWRSPPGCRPP